MPQNETEVEIDPTNLDESTSSLLARLLRTSQKQESVVLKSGNHAYNIISTNQTTNEQTSQNIHLAKHIIKRGRKANKDGVRYEVVDKSQKLGDGAEGVVYKSLGVLITENDTVIFKPKPRAIKVIKNSVQAKCEYEHTARVTHLHTKPLAVQECKHRHDGKTMFKSYMAMRLFNGKELQATVKREISRKPILLTLDQRIMLSLNILHGVQTQVHHHDLVLRDLKTENIILDFETLDINIIDYSYSKDLRNPQDKPLFHGTPELMPPEQWLLDPDDPDGYTIKSDSYAIGRTLAEIWNARLKQTHPEITTRHFGSQTARLRALAKYDCNYNYAEAYFDGLNDQHATQLKKIFEQLTLAAPKERWTLTQAIACLQQIIEERKLEPAAKKLRSINHG